MARGRTDRGGDGDFRFGSSMHGEEIYKADKDKLSGSLGLFCRTTLPWYYLSRFERREFLGDTLSYSDGGCRPNGQRKTRYPQGPVRASRGTTNSSSPPCGTRKRSLPTVARATRARRGNCLTIGATSKRVDLYRITLEGCSPLKKSIPVAGGRLILVAQAGRGAFHSARRRKDGRGEAWIARRSLCAISRNFCARLRFAVFSS